MLTDDDSPLIMPWRVSSPPEEFTAVRGPAFVLARGRLPEPAIANSEETSAAAAFARASRRRAAWAGEHERGWH